MTFYTFFKIKRLVLSSNHKPFFMNHITRFFTLISLFFIVVRIIPTKVDAQELSKPGENISAIANSIYEADDRLFNGVFYQPKHFFAEGNPFFPADEWVESTLFIKGIIYEGIPLKYNIEDDRFIIKNITENRISVDILIHNSFVDSLQLGSHFFHNTDNFLTNNPIGIAELIYRGDSLSAYFKHSTEFLDQLTERLKYGKYLEPKKRIYLFDGTSFFLIQRKKDIYTYFPENNNTLKQFMRKNKIHLKKASAAQIAELIHFCEQL